MLPELPQIRYHPAWVMGIALLSSFPPKLIQKGKDASTTVPSLFHKAGTGSTQVTGFALLLSPLLEAMSGAEMPHTAPRPQSGEGTGRLSLPLHAPQGLVGMEQLLLPMPSSDQINLVWGRDRQQERGGNYRMNTTPLYFFSQRSLVVECLKRRKEHLFMAQAYLETFQGQTLITLK